MESIPSISKEEPAVRSNLAGEIRELKQLQDLSSVTILVFR
jgi:hypothetical protein